MIVEKDLFQVSRIFDWWEPLADTINTPACDPWIMAALKMTVAVYVAALILFLLVLLARILLDLFRKKEAGFDGQVNL